MIRLGPGNIGLLGSGAHRAGVEKIRLGAGALILTLRETGLGSGRSVSDLGIGLGSDPSRSRGFNSYSKERRSPGWGREDPSRSRGFNSCSKERRSPGWGREDRAGVGKIRLGAGVLILTLRRGAHRAGVGKIRLGAGVLILTLRRGARRAGVGKIRLGAGVLILTLSGRSVSEQGLQFLL